MEERRPGSQVLLVGEGQEPAALGRPASCPPESIDSAEIGGEQQRGEEKEAMRVSGEDRSSFTEYYLQVITHTHIQKNK